MGFVYAVNNAAFIHGADGGSRPGFHPLQVCEDGPLALIGCGIKLQILGQQHGELRTGETPLRIGVQPAVFRQLAVQDFLLVELAHIGLCPVAGQVLKGMVGLHSHGNGGIDAASGGGDGAGTGLRGGGEKAGFVNGSQLGVHGPGYILRRDVQVRMVISGGDGQLDCPASHDAGGGTAAGQNGHGAGCIHHQHVPLSGPLVVGGGNGHRTGIAGSGEDVVLHGSIGGI